MNFHNCCRFQVSRHIDGLYCFTTKLRFTRTKNKVATNDITAVELLSFHAYSPNDVQQR